MYTLYFNEKVYNIYGKFINIYNNHHKSPGLNTL